MPHDKSIEDVVVAEQEIYNRLTIYYEEYHINADIINPLPAYRFELVQPTHHR